MKVHGTEQHKAQHHPGEEGAAKVKMLPPSSQHCTWEGQHFSAGKDTEATLIVCSNSAHREMLTLSHTDGSRCQAQPQYGREISCQHVLNTSHSP